MKHKINNSKGSRSAWSLNLPAVRSLFVSALILIGLQTNLQAQDEKYTLPSWYFGAAAGANINFYNGSTQELNSDFTALNVFHKGSGVGLFAAPLLEYHAPGSVLGFMLQAGFDSRKGSFEQILTPCNCPADLSTNLNYVTIEPSLRMAPFKNNFYLYAGPRVAFNLAHSFVYSQGINPDYPEQVAEADVTGDLSFMKKTQLSMQVGAGYDIFLTPEGRKSQIVLSPFVSFHPYFGQLPRSIETWNITTVRVGAALKFGRGHAVPLPAKVIEPMVAIVAAVEPEVTFTVRAPENIPAESTVREIFPLVNNIFFNLGSTEIPGRYVLLRKDQVKGFKDDQPDFFIINSPAGRSDRQMVIYYNVLNILGDRMGRYPNTTIVLVGSSGNGPQDGKAMAESTKTYLVSVFGIESSRITTEGRAKPKIPSEQPGGTNELVLLREGDQQVTIESRTPELLKEYQNGPDTPLKPIGAQTVQEAPLDSYVAFQAGGANQAFDSWSMDIMDNNGAIQHFGPYTIDVVTIPGKTILGNETKGDYKVIMIGQTKSGKEVRQESFVHITRWEPPKTDQMLRYSIIYEFNDSKAIPIYNKYLTDVVIPQIPSGAKVMICGYTDVIGEENHNQELSLARANDVRGIMKKGLANVGRTDVTFEVVGYGENQALSPFKNKYPEERFYNRTVIIDVIPQG